MGADINGRAATIHCIADVNWVLCVGVCDCLGVSVVAIDWACTCAAVWAKHAANDAVAAAVDSQDRTDRIGVVSEVWGLDHVDAVVDVGGKVDAGTHVDGVVVCASVDLGVTTDAAHIEGVITSTAGDDGRTFVGRVDRESVVALTQLDVEFFHVEVGHSPIKAQASNNGVATQTKAGETVLSQVTNIVGGAVLMEDIKRVDLVGFEDTFIRIERRDRIIDSSGWYIATRPSTREGNRRTRHDRSEIPLIPADLTGEFVGQIFDTADVVGSAIDVVGLAAHNNLPGAGVVAAEEEAGLVPFDARCSRGNRRTADNHGAIGSDGITVAIITGNNIDACAAVAQGERRR